MILILKTEHYPWSELCRGSIEMAVQRYWLALPKAELPCEQFRFRPSCWHCWRRKSGRIFLPDYWKKQTGRTENDAVSVSENPETLWYPEGSISSASTHLCYRLYCPWVWCKDAEWIAGTRWCQYYAESICAFLYADEAGICKAIAIDGIIFRRQKIVWKMQKVSETAWLFRIEWSMGGFYETKTLLSF